MTEGEKVPWYIKVWHVFYTGDTGIHVWRWRLVYIWIILFTALTIYSFHSVRHLASQNHKLATQSHKLGVQNHRLGLQNHKLALQGVQAHNAICKFRNDLSRRIDESQHFLDKHPHGIPGIATAGEIRTSLKSQKATLKSFDNFKCKQ